MNVDINRIITPSKLQPQIFKITKKLSADKKGEFWAVVDRSNEVMCYMVSPALFEKLSKRVMNKEQLEKKMEADYISFDLEEGNDVEFERASLKDLDLPDNKEEDEYYRNL
jgi:hypothetical protein